MGAVPGGTVKVSSAEELCAIEDSPEHHRARSIDRLLSGPIAATLAQLAAPNIAEAIARVAFIGFDAYFVGWLGYRALAGVSLVFPLLIVMQTMSSGGMGGGVSSAIARALGAGRREDANALVMHALVIALLMAAVFSGALLLFGPVLYASMEGRGEALNAAVTYSNVIFSGAVFVWLANILANVVRGTGNMVVSASSIVVGEIVHLSLSPLLILGFGPVPRFGVAGAAAAVIISYVVTAAILFTYIAAGRAAVLMSWRATRLRRRLFADILRVGALSSFNAAQTQIINILLAASVGHFGTIALAGYGAALRLEVVQVPLVFALGSAVVTMVGANVGAGNRERAFKVAWTGAAGGALISGAVGALGAIFSPLWIGLFTDNPEVQVVGVTYLRLVGPAYAFLGVGLILFFASQGIGRVLWPVLALASRLAIIAAGYMAVYRWNLGMTGLFILNTAAITFFGFAIVAAFKYRIATFHR